MQDEGTELSTSNSWLQGHSMVQDAKEITELERARGPERSGANVTPLDPRRCEASPDPLRALEADLLYVCPSSSFQFQLTT